MKFWEFGQRLCKALGYEKVAVKSVQINVNAYRDYPEIIITRELDHGNEEDRKILDVLSAADWKSDPQTPEQKEEAYLRWAREFKPEWLPAAMAEADAEQKEQSDACIKHYLDGLHHALFDALTQTRNEQSKDIQARRVIDILLAQRMGK